MPTQRIKNLNKYRLLTLSGPEFETLADYHGGA